MDLGKFGHLTYSTLVHPSDTWPELYDSLNKYVPRVKANVCPHQPFGVSLRLSAASARTLAASASERTKLKRFLEDNHLYLYTVNAFPYGPFKNEVVKERVYEPDWRTEERVRYTMEVAEILADIGSPAANPSIQSPPLGFKPRVTGPEVIEAYAANVRRVAAYLHRIRERTGRTVTLALEPEPFCFLETTEETVDFFARVLRSERSLRVIASEFGVSIERAYDILHEHVGTVFDICHQAVEFEDIRASLQNLADHDVPIFKLQEAAAIQVPSVTANAVASLRPFADSVYLTQTVQKLNGTLTRFLNLEEAFAAFESDGGSAGGREWRTHFHVPVFLNQLGQYFGTTQFAISEALAFHCATPVSRQLEIETYTWDVLPERLKSGDIVDYVSREIEWVKAQLTEPMRQ